MRRRYRALLPAFFFSVTAICFSLVSRGASMTLTPATLDWLQTTPVSTPALGSVKTMTVDFFAKGDGTLSLVLPGLSSGTATLPANRLWYQNTQGQYVPLSAAGSVVDNLPARDRSYVIPINLVAMVQPSDPVGVYRGTMTVQFICTKPQFSESKTINISIEIVPWAQVSYQPDPVQVTSPTGNPGDDLIGQSLVAVQCNGQWSLEISAPNDFVSASASFPSNQAYFSLNPGGPWAVLSPSWYALTSGTGSTQFTLYLRVVQPFNKRAGLYTSPLRLRITTL